MVSTISGAAFASIPPRSGPKVLPGTLAFFSGDVGRSKISSYNRAGRLKSSSFRPICCSSGRNSVPSGDNSSSFCIIEGPETVEDFVQMQLQELDDNIRSRRNKIFLLMEEVRRLRIQQRIKSAESNNESSDENEMPDMPSTIPFLPNMTPKTMKQLHVTSLAIVSGLITFGGLIAPIAFARFADIGPIDILIGFGLSCVCRPGFYTKPIKSSQLELKLGLGGTSYEDFINNMHLPVQLSQVDPIVASFSGGAVGVISALMLIETNNVEQQQKKRCKYCHGNGYLACARCSASGICLRAEPVSGFGICGHPLQPPTTQRCPNCSGTGKVMCPTCLCTGMVMASEHDPRIDPFD